MAMIRHAESQSLARHAVVLDLGDLRRQAEELERRASAKIGAALAEAALERERIIAGAAEEGRATGHAQGLAKGLEEGRAAGRQQAIASSAGELSALTKAWQEALTRFNAQRDELLDGARRDLLRLAAMVASRLAKRTVDADERAAAAQLEAALALTLRPSRLVVEMSPADEALVREVLPGLAQRLAPGAHCETRTNAALSRGSIVLRTELGVVDASLDAQLERLIELICPAQVGHPGAEPAQGAPAPGAGPEKAP